MAFLLFFPEKLLIAWSKKYNEKSSLTKFSACIKIVHESFFPLGHSQDM